MTSDALARRDSREATCAARGRAVAGSATSGAANIRLECLVSAETAERIVADLSKRYFENHAIVPFVEDVWVVRGEKYV